ncbi:PHB depolymerase family esterase [Acidovorax sp. SRB_24]|uniref:extracellular catalytic domain type 1 short-chain-length polyhydroxyalkanoate depolymerase n=1 Tax=Acidovorax sp. SRB_24 TaxID=1962700 RepID=UPI00145EC6E4|nr:PHB depolymerase family esterase [Acidovorax sp. SRB_24]NMM76665.1 esterase [Acidovorax sp. SRB_24]
MDWNVNLQSMIDDATALVRSGQVGEATRAIQRALGGAAPLDAATAGAPPHSSLLPAAGAHMPAPRKGRRSAPSADVEDAVVIERGTARTSTPPRPADAGHATQPVGTFLDVAFAHAGAQHHYHLYVPPGAAARAPLPLVLMLHGCTQNPEDFATGTGMNTAAAQAPALVLYPMQPHSANPHGCWNWFRPENQRRGAGELALLVAMVRDVIARHAVDPQRIYVAGLSAGGAMAALLAREYPDLFAAVGVHSGLQAGAAHNMMAALSAMHNGAKPGPVARPAGLPSHGPAIPIIVFHGDADETVHARNGEQLIAAALAAATRAGTPVRHAMETGRAPGGGRYTRTVYRHVDGDPAHAPGPVVAEHWQLHGAGHAWAGGDARGSHTDPRGVNATREMLRFFLEHPKAQ